MLHLQSSALAGHSECAQWARVHLTAFDRVTRNDEALGLAHTDLNFDYRG